MKVWRKRGLNYKYENKILLPLQYLTPISLSPTVNLRTNHPPPLEGLGEATKKPPDFTPMAWCFAINQTLSLAAT